MYCVGQLSSKVHTSSLSSSPHLCAQGSWQRSSTKHESDAQPFAQAQVHVSSDPHTVSLSPLGVHHKHFPNDEAQIQVTGVGAGVGIYTGGCGTYTGGCGVGVGAQIS